MILCWKLTEPQTIIELAKICCNASHQLQNLAAFIVVQSEEHRGRKGGKGGKGGKAGRRYAPAKQVSPSGELARVG